MKNWILNNLKKTNYKITPTRKRICKQIEKINGIFCAKQIVEQLNINKVSIYRNLEILESLKLIRPAINLKGEQFYEKNNDKNHHHHIICTECLKTSCIKCTEPKLQSKKQFNNVNHLLIFTGLCNTCSK